MLTSSKNKHLSRSKSDLLLLSLNCFQYFYFYLKEPYHQLEFKLITALDHACTYCGHWLGKMKSSKTRVKLKQNSLKHFNLHNFTSDTNCSLNWSEIHEYFTKNQCKSFVLFRSQFSTAHFKSSCAFHSGIAYS